MRRVRQPNRMSAVTLTFGLVRDRPDRLRCTMPRGFWDVLAVLTRPGGSRRR